MLTTVNLGIKLRYKYDAQPVDIPISYEVRFIEFPLRRSI